MLIPSLLMDGAQSAADLNQAAFSDRQPFDIAQQEVGRRQENHAQNNQSSNLHPNRQEPQRRAGGEQQLSHGVQTEGQG